MLSICYSKLVNKDKIIRIFGKSILIVKTGSMEPTIKAGELILISNGRNYKVGDIVTILDNEGYIITHRIINIDNNKVITKGDGNNINDEENSINNIVGKVIFHSYILGFVSVYLLKPITLTYIILFIINSLYNRKRIQGGLKENEKN